MSTTVEILKQKEIAKKNSAAVRVKPGQVLNPKGRGIGTKNKTTLLKEAILQQAEEKVLQEFMKIVETTITLANAGDTACLKMLWDRIIPAKRAVEIDDKRADKMNVVINISGLETKGVKDVEIVDGEVTEVDDSA